MRVQLIQGIVFAQGKLPLTAGSRQPPDQRAGQNQRDGEHVQTLTQPHLPSDQCTIGPSRHARTEGASGTESS